MRLHVRHRPGVRRLRQPGAGSGHRDYLGRGLAAQAVLGGHGILPSRRGTSTAAAASAAAAAAASPPAEPEAVAAERKPVLVLALLSHVCQLFMDDLKRCTRTEADVQHEAGCPHWVPTLGSYMWKP